MDHADAPDAATARQLRWLPGVVRTLLRVPVIGGLIALVVFGVLGLPGDDAADVLNRLRAAQHRVPPADVIEVVVCRVPSTTTVDLYGDLPLRASIDAAALTTLFERDIRPYFVSVSEGDYAPTFLPGDDVVLTDDESYEDCADQALDAASGAATMVVAVADAEHAAGFPGGYGSPGEGCQTDESCTAATSRRYAYVGASDFSGQWADAPPLDLVEHEIGHALGWVHSGTDDTDAYLSALDLMSDSAAPRDSDTAARHAPAPIAFHRFLAGWLGDRDVLAIDDSVTETLIPSNVARERVIDEPSVLSDPRLVVVGVDEWTVLTVEVLANVGYDRHLPHAGVAVHRVVLDENGAITSIDPVTPSNTPPFVDLLQSGESLVVDDWTIEVASWDASGWVISISRD